MESDGKSGPGNEGTVWRDSGEFSLLRLDKVALTDANSVGICPSKRCWRPKRLVLVILRQTSVLAALETHGNSQNIVTDEARVSTIL